MEVAVLPQATHHIELPSRGLAADIYVPPRLEARLGDLSAPDNASDDWKSLAGLFREAITEQTRHDHGVVFPERLTVTKIGASVAKDDEDECDECTSCDIGYHERCRQPGGCPNARRR